jgi:glutathione S-transferase
MELIGYLDSPYVRRVAITLRFLGIDCEHRQLSIWRDFEEFRSLSPLVKVPTLVCDDGAVLVDSTLIIDYLERTVDGDRSLMPAAADAFRDALQYIGTALVGMEKAVQLIYELGHRPREVQHPPWIARLRTQLDGALRLMESTATAAALAGTDWLAGADISQADITTAVAWRFIRDSRHAEIDAGSYPALAAFSERAESLPEFLACSPQ